ncbi:class I SAM-dependent methyltransferase [Streptomyces zingiberis]|uniref:Class I SAM-dependent methyltransferase n=1 Tax=Streptomyces zingiberis TaxID=2053010 RepID=A0ABX1BU33_9ACTN|nr:class I SAM-dependent methyltransferase [Streptomyces zingiberis]NJQ01229.1 class I SAM-dependent methyltransferase [Streptomyces zingiberis]
MARSAPRRPLFARYYAHVAGPALEKAGAARHRRSLLEGLTGRVVEIGAGHGLNFPHYPPGVAHLLAVEPEPRLRALAADAARAAPVPVEVAGARGERLPADGASFDAAVVSLTLCSVGDQAAVLAEIRRVLRPGGHLRFFEHVRAVTSGTRRVQRVLDATVWPLLCGGCHLGRDTVAAIRDAGFTVTALRTFTFPAPGPAGTCVLGTAEKPPAPAPPPERSGPPRPSGRGAG